jgi:CSLREA domain-containing protein
LPIRPPLFTGLSPSASLVPPRRQGEIAAGDGPPLPDRAAIEEPGLVPTAANQAQWRSSGSTLPRKRKPTAVLVFAVLVAILAAPSVGRASTFTVNSTLDDVDATPGDGICATSCSICTLRAAIMEANALAGADTIIVPAGTYTLSLPGANEDLAETGDLDITSTIIIQGAGADVTTVDAGGLDRVFDVIGGGDATLQGLRITGGTTAGEGGGIQSLGTLLVERSAVVGNTGNFGGGIFSSGDSVSITDTAISGNIAFDAGGAYLQSTVSQALTNATISGNSAALIGGLIIFNGATFTNVTIASNVEAAGPGHSLALVSGITVLRNTLIVKDHVGPNCIVIGTLVDDGGNFAADEPCGPIPATAAVATNLGALTVNAPGRTATHALLPGNPAIGGGVTGFCPGADQRGVTRVGVLCDSGAYQFSAPAAVPPPPPPLPSPAPTPPRSGVVPTISRVVDQTIPQNGAVSIPFTISGAVIAYALRTSATTSNPGLFPSLASSISCDQLGHCRLELTPADGRAGGATVTITVSDGINTTSQRFNATVVARRPSVPTGVAATTIGSGLTLTWTPPDTGTPFAYVLAWGTAAGGSNLPVQIIEGSATRFDVPALPGGAYFVRLAAVGTADVSPASPERQVVVTTSASVPGPPIALETADVSGGLQAIWQTPIIGAAPTLYEEEIGTAPGLRDVDSATTSDTPHTVPVTAGAYWVRVRAMTGGAVGPWSSSVQITIGAAGCTSAPAAPVLLPVTLTPGAAAFTWIPGGEPGDRYQVQVSPGAGLAPIVSMMSRGSGTSVVWAAPQGTWAGRVIARNACGASAPSNEMPFAVTP